MNQCLDEVEIQVVAGAVLPNERVVPDGAPMGESESRHRHKYKQHQKCSSRPTSWQNFIMKSGRLAEPTAH